MELSCQALNPRRIVFFPIPRHLKFLDDQTYYQWVDEDAIMSNMTIEHDPIRKNYLLDPLDAKSLDNVVVKS